MMDTDCNTQNLFQSQDGENDPDSPITFSMTQRAKELGIDVIWRNSPRIQKKSRVNKKKPQTDSTPTTTIVRRSPSVKNRKQLFKPSIDQPPPKTGIYKFMEEVRSMCPNGSSSWPPRLPSPSTPRTATSNGVCEIVHTDVDANVTNLLCNTASDSVSWNDTKFCKDPKLQSDKADELSSSLQNEFLNDTTFDLELIKTSQEAEEQLREQQQNNRNSMLKFFDDSFDNLFASKELDQLIAQSQQMDAQPKKINQSLERHKSMPTDCTRTPLNRRFID